MNARGNSSPGIVQDRAGGAARDGPGRHRVRGWRPRTSRAKAGLAAVAAVGATGLAVALAAGPAGAATKPAWSMTAGNVQSMSQTDSATTSYFFNTSTAYGAGASLVKTPVQPGYATTPVLNYTSYARFSSDIPSGAITYPYKWVMYDPEDWSQTPVGEQQDPVKYMELFGQLAHAHGLKVIQAPALDLGSVTGTAPPAASGESCSPVVRPGQHRRGGRRRGDIYLLQDESNTTVKGQYAPLFNTTENQARAANSKVLVFSEVSTVNGTAAQMATAAESIRPDGFYVAAAGKIAQTLQFFRLMRTAGY